MGKLTQQELDERIAVLRKFRTLLEQQRDKFREYLDVLEKQQDSILSKDAETLKSQTELEKDVVKNIVNLQKVIVPMHDLCNAVDSSSAGTADDARAVPELQSDLADLKQKVLTQNRKNRALLQSRMTTVHTQLASLKNPYRYNRSVYAEKKTVGRLVEVEA